MMLRPFENTQDEFVMQTLSQLSPRIHAALLIHSQAISHNLQLLSKQLSSAQIYPVLKADCYGLGAKALAPLFVKEKSQGIFVAYLDEGIELRSIIPSDIPIFVLNGLFSGIEREFLEYNLIPVITDLHTLHLWKSLAKDLEKTLPAVLHLDTGMNRTGIKDYELLQLLNHPKWEEGISWKLIMSHYTSADSTERESTLQQLQKFSLLSSHFKEVKTSLANSAGIFQGTSFHGDVVRPGMALWGLNPTPYQENPMSAVVSLWARVYQVKQVGENQTIGYMKTYRTQRQSRIATLAIGYADGYPWSLSNQGTVTIAGHQAPIVGRISMDLITVDVSDIPENLVYPGMWARMEWDDMSSLANKAHRIDYEMLLNLGKRFSRVII